MSGGLSRRHFLAASAATTLGALAARAETPASRPPNIVFILTDDQRHDFLGCAGHPFIQTPAIDALAEQGVRFRNAFVTTPICCASRASILTGMYARSCGVHDFTTALAPDLQPVSYPAQLRAAGYRTGFAGKFGVGLRPPEGLFDFFKGLPAPNDYFPLPDAPDLHLTGILGDYCLEFLEGCTLEQPFCLSLSTYAPHAHDNAPRPYPPDPALEGLYADAEVAAAPLSDPAVFDALPAFLRESEGRRRWQNRFTTHEHHAESVRDYCRLITGVDRVVGRIRETLEARGLAENTIIIFTSDNGSFLGERGQADKWYAYEDSIRVPMIVFDPRAESSLRGRTVDAMALNIDLAPTMLAYAGLPAPEVMQGATLMPWLRGDTPDWREDWFFEHLFPHPGIPKSEGIRTERFKYFRWIESEPMMEELYDLATDPLETKNLLHDPAYADTLGTLRARYDEYRETLPDRWSNRKG